ncbi:hypothetical protein HPB52_005072 [Rhipicephalus sanguineus]|uniref:Uncharacterized protein n=1 Tax=Rhipicephalus sanguineus TaxID=34632 RepID=A0A9D4SQC0_RHISA|nr:hypothetical protein HPB52_005072 [Rhipicephalus sanguineus]
MRKLRSQHDESSLVPHPHFLGGAADFQDEDSPTMFGRRFTEVKATMWGSEPSSACHMATLSLCWVPKNCTKRRLRIAVQEGVLSSRSPNELQGLEEPVRRTFGNRYVR